MEPQSLSRDQNSGALGLFHPVLGRWFTEALGVPTPVQTQAWPAIAAGRHTLLLAPTGSGKTLAAFLVAIDRIMFPAAGDALRLPPRPAAASRTRAFACCTSRRLRPSASTSSGICGCRSPECGRWPSVSRSSTRCRWWVYVRATRPPLIAARLQREPPDILITTPESLYLMLTSRVRDTLATVDTLIVDEIHSLVATKRGAHLFVSLERLEDLRQAAGSSRPLQRIGLSATQRPLDEVARLLGGAVWEGPDPAQLTPRPVQIVEAGRGKQLDLRIEVPVEDMTQLAGSSALPGSDAGRFGAASIWPLIHPRLVQLIREHRSTMIFVNSRRLAERLATAINELAEEEIALAHHGSIAKATRLLIEDRLKRGQLPAIVATSSLELGIDMGAVDLVIQIEAPPSIASGIQRIGRSGHQVGACSKGIVFPKYRGDLLACSAAAQRMMNGEVESTYYLRNPLDVLAQQLVAMAALETMEVARLYMTVRRAAPFHDLPRSSFDGVLDLLTGCYPSDEFSELRPRLNWDRLAGTVSPRRGSQRLAIFNAGTIPDRGLYGVYLAADAGRSNRVGELDEEMVFETRPGEVFRLGASSWRVLEITNDKVLVAPAPGEPGKMPFWHGDGPGRPLEFGRAIGRLTRELLCLPHEQACQQLVQQHGLDGRAAGNLLKYLSDQVASTGEPPSDQTIVVERFLDEVGDWRIAILSPFGAGSTRPGRRPSRRGYAPRAWAKSTCCGRTMALCFACRRPTPGRRSRCCCRNRTKSKTWLCTSWVRRRCLQPAFAKTPPVRCCCRDASRGVARPSGSSAAAPPTCCP